MVASIVQSASALSSTTSATVTLGATPTPGNTLLAVMASDTTSSAVPNAGTSKPYTVRSSDVQNMGWYVWTRLVVSGDAAATTFTPTSAAPAALMVIEVQGTFDKNSTVVTTINASGNTRTATTVTPATTDGIVVAVAGLHGLNTVISGVSVDNSFTTLLTQPNAATGGTFVALLSASRVTSAATATGTTTFTWTGNSTDRNGIQVAFTGISVAAGTRPRRIGKRR